MLKHCTYKNGESIERHNFGEDPIKLKIYSKGYRLVILLKKTYFKHLNAMKMINL